MSSDNALHPLKLRFGRSILSPFDDSVVHGSTVKLPPAPQQSHEPAVSQWATFAATSGLMSSFGSFSFSVHVDSVGSGVKPIVIGLVPRSFTAYDAKLSAAGWGVASNGKVHAYNASPVKHDVASMSFVAGDRVTVKVDCNGTRPAMTFVVESKKTKKSSEHVVKVPSLGGDGAWVVPAVSLASPGAGVTLETLVDTTPLDVFGSRLSDADNLCYDCDALGSYFLRWYRRMSDNDTVKTSQGTFTKADVRFRAVLFGHETSPCYGRSPLAGLLDSENSRKAMSMRYNEACNAVMTDAAASKKLGELIKSPPDHLKPLLAACASPIALGFVLAHAAMPAPTPTPPPTVIPSSPRGSHDGDSPTLKSLADRVSQLEKGRSAFAGDDNSPSGLASGHSGGTKSSTGLRRTASVAGSNDSVLNRRRSSVGRGQLTAAPRVAAARRPMSKGRDRPTMKRTQPAKVVVKDSSSNQLQLGVQKIRKMLEDLREMQEKGSPTDADMRAMRAHEESVGKARVKLAKDITAMDEAKLKNWTDAETKEDVGNLLEDLIAKGDQHAGSIELVQALLKKVPMDFSTVIKESNLPAVAAYDGSINFLKVLLGVPNLSLDLVELVECAVFNQTHRIPVTLLLLDNWEKLGLASVAEEIEDAWQEFFEDISSKERAKEREDRKDRLQLVARMLKHATPKVDPMNEGSDGQTVFSRAAREGDIELMSTLISTAASSIDVNHVSSIDKTTALIQAVMKNQVQVVKILSSLPTVNKKHECEEGSALSMARTLKRDPEIIKALES